MSRQPLNRKPSSSSRNCFEPLFALARDERGQVLPMAAIMMVLVLSIVALVTDVGRAFYSQRALQATTDASALAGADALRTATTLSQVTALAMKFSAVTGNGNARANLPNVSMIAGYPAVKCLVALQTQGMACVGNVPYNAVQVKQRAIIPMIFAGLFGHPTVIVAASSTAAAHGGSPTPFNIAIIMDTTLSVYLQDTDCAATELQCALNGLQVLLQNLDPCAKSILNCVFTNGVASSPVDQVSLFTFPNVSAATASIDTQCTTAVPSSYYYWSVVNSYIVMPPAAAYGDIATAVPYTTPVPGSVGYYPGSGASGTYQITPFLSDYRASSSADTLNAASDLVKAAAAIPGCGGIAPSNYDGVYGTYYAGVFYAAQSALIAQQATSPGTENAIILLSDGDATAPKTSYNQTVIPGANGSGSYPSYLAECGQAIVAAQAAATAGTRVYSIAYGSKPTGCTSDQGAGPYPGISPCDTMANLASAPQYFYSDYKQSGSGSTCYSSQPITSLHDIFAAIAADLSTARLIPDNVT